ncbi:MAG: ABC transporter substrate-binding protein, partial [Dehalococcoidia bacterium]|nr:ABC transporter substrate-binding protein [Dehalococcoidia bacterium]
TLQRLQSEISIKDLIGGGHDFEASVGSATTAILAGAKLKVLSIAGEKLPWSIIARPEIKSVQNLKGKRIGLSSLGSVVQQASMIALKNHGLDPSKDVIWMAAGGAEAAVKMILVGSIDAAVLSGAYILQLEKQGYNTVINLGDELKGVTNGLVTHDKFLQERPQTVKKVLRGLLKGQKFYVSQVPKARAYYLKFAKENGDLDEALATELYDREAKQMNDSGYISDDVLRTWIGYLKVEAQVDRDVPLSEVYDLSIIKQVSQELKDWKP